MKIKTFGYRAGVSSLAALEKAFIDLGHEVITEDEPDLIFDLNGWFDDAIAYGEKYPKAKKIFNLLNADVKNPNWGAGKIGQLSQASICTTVSESTRNDILKRTGVDCEVIYFPMKAVSHLNYMKTIEFLYVGRLYNPEKRFMLVKDILEAVKFPTNKLVVAGPEQPPFGIYTGLLPENHLNELYNSCSFLLAPCEREGSMSIIEGAVAGCFPIVAYDNFWAHEFGFSEFTADPNPLSMAAKIMTILHNKDHFKKILDDIRPGLLEKFAVESVAKRVISLYNQL